MQSALSFSRRLATCLTAGTLMLTSCASSPPPHPESAYSYYPHCAEPLLHMRARDEAAVASDSTKMNQTADENTRLASIRVTANQDLSKANSLQLDAYACISCYTREFDALLAGYENGLLGRAEYAERFGEIHRGMVALGETIGTMDSDIRRMEREFNESMARYPERE